MTQASLIFYAPAACVVNNTVTLIDPAARRTDPITSHAVEKARAVKPTGRTVESDSGRQEREWCLA